MIRSTTASQMAAPMFIRALADDQSLKVIFDGNTPGYARDKHAIYLPSYASFTADQLSTSPDLCEVQAAVQDLFLGTGLHEIGHPTETSPETAHRNTGQLGKFLWNAIEDIRVDSNRQRKLAGAKRIFNAGYGRLIKMGYWGKGDMSDLKGAFTAWVLLQGRFILADQVVFKDLAAASDAALRSIAGDAFADEAWDIVCRVQQARPGIEGTQDVFNIVEDLLSFLQSQQQAQQPELQPQPQGTPQQGDSDDDSNDCASGQSGASGAQDDSDDAADGDDDAGDSSKGSQASDSSEDDSDDGTSGQSGASGAQDDSGDAADGDDDAGDSSKGSQASDSTDDDSDDATSGQSDASGTQDDSGDPVGSQPSGSTSSTKVDPDQVRQLLDATDDDLPDAVGDAFAKALDDASSQAFSAGATEYVLPRAEKAVAKNVLYAGDRDTRPLSMRVSRLLEAQSRDNRSYDRMGSRMDTSLLSRVPLGERDVFVDELPTRRVDTAIQVIVDDSCSMRSFNRIGIAKSASLRLCIALSEIKGINLRATAFPHVLDNRSDQVLELLPFGAQPRRYAENFLKLSAQGPSTPLAEALTDAHYSLARRSEPRKIAVVLTDGEPDGGTYRVAPIIERMRKSHIEVIGLGIQTMTYPDLFSRFEIVQNVADLETALFKLLQSTILKRAA